MPRAGDQTGATLQIAGIIPAAGVSSRMGTNKLLLDLHGTPVVRRVAASAVEAELAPVIVVLGFEADEVRDVLAGLTVETVINPDYRRGMNSSVRLGLDRVPADIPAAVIMLGDMPLVTSAMIETLVAQYRTHRAPLVTSRFGQVRAPPTLFDRSLFAGFRPDGDGAGRQLVRTHAERAITVDFPATALADLDSPADYEFVKRSS